MADLPTQRYVFGIPYDVRRPLTTFRARIYFFPPMKFPPFLLQLAAVIFFALPRFVSAEIVWIDFQASELQPALLHRAFPVAQGSSLSIGEATLTLTTPGIEARTRTYPNELLKDFAFVDGEGLAISLTISGLPAGSYRIDSWHFDASFTGSIQVEFGQIGMSPQIPVSNHPFSTIPASYTITVDGVSTYELSFRENHVNNRSRLNGLRLRPAGSPEVLPGIFVDIDSSNTAAVGDSPDPFYIDDGNDPGFTNGNLWRRRPGFGFNVAGHREIFEKNANGGFGNAAPLVTTFENLPPGSLVGVFVAYLSVPTENWQVKAGLDPDSLTLFTPRAPNRRVLDLGRSHEANSNRNQYLGFVGNIEVAPDGTIQLFAEDGGGTAANFSERTWLEGWLVGDPLLIPPLPGNAVEIAPDGAWTWFNDERTIVHEGSLFSGYVRSNGHYGVTRYDFEDGKTFHATISTGASAQQDDHNNPSLTVLPDGRLLALYAKHIAGNQFYQRTSLVTRPGGIADWGPEIVHPTPADNTYNNTYLLADEGNRIYNFHRSINFNPNLTISNDLGATWEPSLHFITAGSGSVRPYTRFASNKRNRIDLIYTDGHPRDIANSLYHLYYHDGAFRRTDGSLIKSFANLPINHSATDERGSVIYAYNAAPWAPADGPDDWIPTGRAWNLDVHYGRDDHPIAAFQVKVSNVTGTGWNHNRIYYYYARWTGSAWQKRFIAHAGRPLYSAEGDYAGGMAIDPVDPRIVYISSNAASPFALDDLTDVPLRDGDRYELWRGFTEDDGFTFDWTQLTFDSYADNLRPIVPENHGRTECLIWFYGTYSSYTNYSTQVIGRIGEPATTFADWADSFGLAPGASPHDDADGDGLANLLEYGLGGDPLSPGSAHLPRWTDAALEFSLDRSLTDIEWVVENSGDLRTWKEIALLRPVGLPSRLASGWTAELPELSGAVRINPRPDLPPIKRQFFRVTVRTPN